MATTVQEYGVTVVTKDDSTQFLKETELNVKSALKAMADATLQRALMLTPAVPWKTGQLSGTGITFTRDGGYESVAQFGAGIEYARYQEYGSPDPSEPWNYTTAGTGAFFLQTAGNSVAKEGIQAYL